MFYFDPEYFAMFNDEHFRSSPDKKTMILQFLVINGYNQIVMIL